MKIAFVSTLNNTWGGSEVLWHQCALKALEQKHKIILYVCEYLSKDIRILSLVDQGAKLIVWPINKVALQSSFIKKGIEFISFKLQNKKSIRKFLHFQPDVLLINQADTFESPKNPIFYSICEHFGKKVSILSHGNFEHLIMDYESIMKSREVIDLINTFYFVSHRNKETAEHQIAYKIQNAKVIGNHPFIKMYDYIPYPQDETIQFACVARFDLNFKAQDLLLQILSQPKWRERKWYLNFYGEGRDYAILYDMVKYYNLSEYVTFHGQVSDQKQVWKSNHILLLASYAEGLPLVVQEAMLCGRTVLVSDVAGNTEIVEDNVNGFVIDAPCLKLIDLKLEEAWQKRKQWEAMGKLAHQTIKDKIDFNPEISLLNDLLKI